MKNKKNKPLDQQTTEEQEETTTNEQPEGEKTTQEQKPKVTLKKPAKLLSVEDAKRIIEEFEGSGKVQFSYMEWIDIHNKNKKRSGN